MQPGRRKHQSATIIVDRRVRAAGLEASHRHGCRGSEHVHRECRSVGVGEAERDRDEPAKTEAIGVGAGGEEHGDR